MVDMMFWNLCKSSWRKGLHFLIVGAVFVLVVQEAKASSLRGCGRVFEGHSLKEGKDAGEFKKLSRTKDPEKCIQDCCSDSECKTALFVGKLQACYSVECKSSDACKPVRASKTSLKYNLTIFKKDTKENEDTDSSFSQHKSCHHYHGTQSGCKVYLNNKLLYFNRPPAEVEKSLINPMKKLKQKLSKSCQKYALTAVCHYAFPYCTDRMQPAPLFLCQEDCEQLYTGVCKNDFELVTDEERGFLPDCKTLPSATKSKCIKLDIPASLQVTKVETKPTASLQSPASKSKAVSNAEDDDDDLKLFKQQINTPAKKQTTDNIDDVTSDNDSHHDLDMEKHSATDDDISGKQNTIPTAAPTLSTATRQKGVSNNNADGDKDLNSPKRYKIPTTAPTNTATRHKGLSDNNDNEDLNSPKSNTIPTAAQTNTATRHKGVSNNDDDEDLSSPKRNKIPTAAPTNTATKQKGVSNNDDDEDLSSPKRNKIPTAAPTNTATKQKGVSNNNADDDEDLNSPKSNKIPTAASTSAATRKKGVSNDDDDADLNSPKRNKITENTNNKVDKKELEDNGDRVPTKPTALPSTRPLKMLGLGLKNSLNLLEPTAPEKSRGTPTVASQTTLKHEDKPTFVNVSSNVNNDEIDLAVTSEPIKNQSAVPTAAVTQHQLENNTSTSSPNNPTPSSASTTKPTEAPPTLQVSAGSNKVLTLPANSIELYASAFPKETGANPYTYHWQQMSSPQDSHGYMEGKDTRRVILTKLSHVGVYQFKVTVKDTANGAFGFAFINVTVRPVPRVNKPPRADISPKEQVITLPTNEVVLDGSKSSDDDKIVQYKWEEVKGPLNDKNKIMSSGADSPVLQLKSLVPGIYTFKLTVVDSDGEKDETTATVTVNDEKDYPPVARAGNDVILTLPVNHVILKGNSSTDNKGIVSYEWSKSQSSPAVGDMQGTNSPFLKVSNMVVGDYTFILKVTDTGGLTSTSKVTVVVQPEKNMPPVAKAGSDKDLVYPDDSTTLDASESTDDQKIVKYQWDQESGPSKAEISGADGKVATVKQLQEGHYVFKLTVTDSKGLTGTDTVAVSVKKDINQAPVANAGPDVVVHLPNRAAELDGSKSSDDHGIAKYTWLRDPKSPAAGDVINNSDHQAILRLSNLVEGMYKFKLTVLDAKGLQSDDEALLTVKEDENSAHLVELYLDVDITRFTEENKGQLIRKLAVILDVQDDDIVVEHLKEAGTGHSMMVMFYVKGGSMAKDGQAVAEMLKSKIENEEGFFEFRMLKVEPYICRNNCSFHGYCDRRTKLCVCESFWMQDIFKSSFGVKESNCDWSILYVTVIIFGIVMGIGGIVWAVCFCLGRRRRGRSRRRHRYAIIDEDDDDDKAEIMEMLPKHKYSSLTLTDSDEDSDETTLFEAKKRIPNGSANGTIGRKAM